MTLPSRRTLLRGQTCPEQERGCQPSTWHAAAQGGGAGVSLCRQREAACRSEGPSTDRLDPQHQAGAAAWLLPSCPPWDGVTPERRGSYCPLPSVVEQPGHARGLPGALPWQEECGSPGG